jgi:hypothetical protein
MYTITLTSTQGETQVTEYFETIGAYLNGATSLLKDGMYTSITVTYKADK